MVACALSVGAQVPQDVPADHWAYEAVKEMASRGYVLGYPDGNFLGNRAMTRYEFATVVSRILEGVSDQLAARPSESKPTATTAPATKAEVTAADLSMVKKLVDEFKVELTVIGTKLEDFDARLNEMGVKVEQIDAIVSDPEGPLQSTMDNVSKLKKVAVSGYVQVRYQSTESALGNENEEKSGVDNTFNIRRARMKITAKPTANTVGVFYLDAGGNKVGVKEAYVGYNWVGDPTLGPSFLIGQQNWPFGYEVSYSSSKRETPERALFVRRFFPGERDRLAKLSWPMGKQWFAQLAVAEGSGVESYTTYKVTDTAGKTQKVSSSVANDFNNDKDAIANVQFCSDNMEFGASYYQGVGIWDKDRTKMDSDNDKVRYGADLRFYWDKVTFKAEYIRAKGIDQTDTTKFNVNDWVNGYYTQLNLNASSSDVLVARWESLSQDPLYPDFGRRSAWNLGWIHYLDDKQKVKFFYQINKEELKSIKNNLFIAEWLMTY